MRRTLVGRRLVVTGAARGIGENVARLAVARGACVALVGLEADRLKSLADELGPSASWCEADVRDGAALRTAIDESAEVMGGIDLERDLPSFERLRDELPYPGNIKTSVEKASGAIVDTLVSRRARVYVPGAVGVISWAKAALSSPVAWLWTKRFAAKWVPTLEREIAALLGHD